MVRVHWPRAASPRSLPPFCCLGPLVPVLLGFSDAWIGKLTALAPYRPIFIAVAMGFQFSAYRRIIRRTACSAGQCVCHRASAHGQQGDDGLRQRVFRSSIDRYGKAGSQDSACEGALIWELARLHVRLHRARARMRGGAADQIEIVWQADRTQARREPQARESEAARLQAASRAQFPSLGVGGL